MRTSDGFREAGSFGPRPRQRNPARAKSVEGRFMARTPSLLLRPENLRPSPPAEDHETQCAGAGRIGRSEGRIGEEVERSTRGRLAAARRLYPNAEPACKGKMHAL